MKNGTSLIIAAIVFFCVSSLFFSYAWAQSTTLFVSPPTTTVSVGESFTISLNVTDVEDLVGYNIYLGYNTTVLTATEVIVDNTWFTTGQSYTIWANETDDFEGIVHVSVTLTGAEEGVSGSGDLFRIVFNTDSSGSSLLDIFNDILVDPLFVAIPHSTFDGTVETVTHDVAVYHVVASKTIVGQGFRLYINVTVANEGDYAETFDVTAYANTTIIKSQNVTLTSGNSTTVTFEWNTTGFVYGDYTISAYATPDPSEVDVADNTYSNGKVLVTITGDCNGDRIVDIFDIGAISAHWYPGPPAGPLSYDANCDANDDGSVDIFDIGITSAHWGESW